MSVSDADMFRAAAPSQQRPSAATLRKVLPLLPGPPILMAPAARRLLATLRCHLGLCSAVSAPADVKRLGTQGRLHIQ